MCAMRSTSPASADTRFTSLRNVLSEREGTPFPTFHESEGRVHAAVSLILRSGPELEVLLIRRAEAERDPWSGQMALPGGRRDPQDDNLLATAVRESWEETGVQLDQWGTALGKLNPLIPATKRLPPISIFPFVFGVGEETLARVASPEVDEVLWTPLSHLTNPEASGTVEIHFDGAPRNFPCFRVEERVIWGLTYRILTDLFHQIEEHSPEVLESR